MCRRGEFNPKYTRPLERRTGRCVGVSPDGRLHVGGPGFVRLALPAQACPMIGLARPDLRVDGGSVGRVSLCGRWSLVAGLVQRRLPVVSEELFQARLVAAIELGAYPYGVFRTWLFRRVALLCRSRVWCRFLSIASQRCRRRRMALRVRSVARSPLRSSPANGVRVPSSPVAR